MKIMRDRWMTDSIKQYAPYAKSVRVIEWYRASCEGDVNVEYSRKIGGYSNWHYLPKDVATWYGGVDGFFDKDYNLIITI